MGGCIPSFVYSGSATFCLPAFHAGSRVAFLHSSIRVLQLYNQKLGKDWWDSSCIPSFVYSGSATMFCLYLGLFHSSCIPSFVYSGSATRIGLPLDVCLIVAFLHSSIRVLQLCITGRMLA